MPLRGSKTTGLVSGHMRRKELSLSEEHTLREFVLALPGRTGIFALSDDFIKSVERIDRKLQGRVLEAIAKIARAPTTVVG
jgi:hypothetical protein